MHIKATECGPSHMKEKTVSTRAFGDGALFLVLPVPLCVSQEAGLDRMLSETQNFTLFIPSVSAMQKMTKEDKDFWTSQANLPSIIK